MLSVWSVLKFLSCGNGLTFSQTTNFRYVPKGKDRQATNPKQIQTEVCYSYQHFLLFERPLSKTRE